VLGGDRNILKKKDWGGGNSCRREGKTAFSVPKEKRGRVLLSSEGWEREALRVPLAGFVSVKEKSILPKGGGEGKRWMD